jgi:hypothetical protein
MPLFLPATFNGMKCLSDVQKLHFVFLFLLRIKPENEKYAHLYLQLFPLQRGSFTGSIREAHALDWYRRYKRLICLLAEEKLLNN